jgi:hypothetical protein
MAIALIHIGKTTRLPMPIDPTGPERFGSRFGDEGKRRADFLEILYVS